MSLFLITTSAIIAYWKLDGKMEVVIELLKSEKKSETISALSLIIFVGMSLSWLAFAESKLNFCPYLHAKRNKEHCSQLDTSPILSMLGWLWYFTMDLTSGSLMLPK